MGASFVKLKNQIVKNFKKKRYNIEYFLKNTLRTHNKDVDNSICANEHPILNNILQSPCDD